MPQIHIVKSTGTPWGDRVLKGVYGTLNESGVFAPAPEFSSISHLFQMIGTQGVPIQLDDFQVFEVAADQSDVFRAQLMRALGDRWAEMYSGMIPAQPGLMTSMLQAESSKVQEGIKSYLHSAQMLTWLVPIKARALTHWGVDPVGVAIQMQRRIPATSVLENEIKVNGGYSLVSVDPSERVVGLGYLHSVTAEDASQVDPQDGAPVSGQTDLPEWASFVNGIDAQITGNIMVCARSAAEAVVGAGWKLAFNNCQLGDLNVAITGIESMRENVQDLDRSYQFPRGM